MAHWLWYFATEHEFIGSIPCCGGRIPGQGAEYENARVYLHLTALMSHAFFFFLHDSPTISFDLLYHVALCTCCLQSTVYGRDAVE